MILAKNKIIPPQEWYHNKYLVNFQDESVYDLLENNDIKSPKEWEYDDDIMHYLIDYCDYYDNDN